MRGSYDRRKSARPATSLKSSPNSHFLGDDAALNFIGAAADHAVFRFAKVTLHVVFRKLRIASERLHPIEGDSEKDLRAEQLRHGNLLYRALSPRHFACRGIHQQSRRFQLGFVFGHAVLEHLEGSERYAELLAVLGVADRIVES